MLMVTFPTRIPGNKAWQLVKNNQATPASISMDYFILSSLIDRSHWPKSSQ